MTYEVAKTEVKVGFDGWKAPSYILDYPTLPDDTVVIAVWNGKSWPDGSRVISYLTDKKDAMNRRFLWNVSCENAMQFKSKHLAYDWLIMNDTIAKRGAVKTILELKQEVGFPTGPWRRKTKCP
ncbi:hypothetical protein [Sinorhizobium meliloti]|uniref:hypothetical protein n=1 Tax=Rhizobium meliloti TaxID=382 RepID=UPI001295BE13|nr:hypothetical protein [Sinorhizobium meliloti]MDW9491724.1 hypothetical protein [Sinorhizobium meliloti]MQV02990.1 hypothetical protein [Sinorhizobium meliloti]